MELGMASNELGFHAFGANTCKLRVLFALVDRRGGCQGQFCSSLSTMELGMASNELGFRAFGANTCKLRVLFALAGRRGDCLGQFCSSLWTMALGMTENELGFRRVQSQHLQAEGALRSGGLTRRLCGAVMQLS